MRRARKNTISHFSHVIVQGIEKQYIFEKKIYKEKYFRLIQEGLEKFNIKLLAYAIMDNHTHMCIYYQKIEDVSKFMHIVNSKFANYYNHLENRVGYLFRNRFYSQEIQDRQQLFNVIAYIHNNPLKAKIADNLEEYEYTSYKNYKENSIPKEIILLVFDTLEYQEIFDFIHKNYSEIDVKDVKEEKNKNYTEVVADYLKENKVSLNMVKKEKNLLIDLIERLKKETNINHKEISKLLEIDKNRLTRINKKILERGKKMIELETK